MKKKINIIVFYSLVASMFIFGQDNSTISKIPNIDIKLLNGKTTNIYKLLESGPLLMDFWATWCKPCKKELNTIAEVYDDWQEEFGVKLIAISIDDTRSMSKVAPYVNSSDWDYEVYLDSNSDLKRAMGVSTVPHTFLINGEGKIVWNHKGYIDGDEEELYEQLQHLATK